MSSVELVVQSSLTDVSFRWPAWAELFSVLTFQTGFNASVVILGATLLGAAAGLIGGFALLRRRALISDALAHSALPGLALFFLISVVVFGAERSLFWLLCGATVSGVLGVMCIQFLTRHTRLSEDSAIGAILSVFFGAGIVLMSIVQTSGSGQAAGLSHFIYGHTASMLYHDAVVTLIVAVGSLTISLLALKEFRLVCFDAEFAEADGWPVQGIDLLMLALVVLITVIGLQTVGMLLIVALLIVPAAAARFWTERLSVMLGLSLVFGACSGFFGAAFSALLPRLPAGAVIVLVAGALFLFSFLCAPRRGLLAASIRHFSTTIRIVSEHILRDLGEELEKQGKLEQAVQVSAARIPFVAFWSPLRLKLACALLPDVRASVSYHVNDQLSLTTHGVSRVKQLIRNHRLWECYVMTYADVAVTHVDYAADYVEHVLSPDIVRKLEARLGIDDVSQLPSPHPLQLKEDAASSTDGELS